MKQSDRAARALQYVRTNVEEFRPDTAKLLIGALHIRGNAPERRVIEASLRVKVLEGALELMTAKVAANEALQQHSCVIPKEQVTDLIKALDRFLPVQTPDERLSIHELRRTIQKLKDLL